MSYDPNRNMELTGIDMSREYRHPKSNTYSTHPRFNIGDVVYNKVEKRGSYGPSICDEHTRLTVDKVERSNGSFAYTCGYEGYRFYEDELMTRDEYRQTI